MRRALLLLPLALVSPPAAAAAEGQRFAVVAVPGFDLADARSLPRPAAVGLVVPDAGPRTSEERARAALLRGSVRNSLRDGFPEGPELIELAGRAQRPLIVVGTPRGGTQPNDRRYLIAVVGRGYRGLLTSESTRIPGLVSVVDVAPTALGRTGRLRSEPHGDAVAHLREIDARIGANNRWRLPVAMTSLAIAGALAFVAPVVAAGAFAAILLGNLVLGVVGLSGAWALLLLAAPALALRRRVFLLSVGAVAAYALALALDETWVALSPLGPSQNGRFYGVSNLLETLLLVPALAGAELARRRFGWPGFGAVAALSLATVASSRLGADGGGAIVLAVGYAVLAARIAPRRRALVAAVAVAAVGLLVAADLVFGPSTHVTESLAGGPGEVARDVAERAELSFLRATANPVTAVVVAASVLVLVFVVARGRRAPLPLAVAASVVASLLVNDSPREVAVGGLAAYLAVERFTRVREQESRPYNGGTPLEGAGTP